SPWWKKVDRIVLFAAPNRGIETRRLSWRAHWREKAALFLPRREGGPGRLMRDQLVGSAAVTNLRIRWIRFIAGLAPLRRAVSRSRRPPGQARRQPRLRAVSRDLASRCAGRHTPQRAHCAVRRRHPVPHATRGHPRRAAGGSVGG